MIDEENERKEEENQSLYQGSPGSSYQGSSSESPQKSNKKKPILIVLAAVAACCIGVLIFAFVTGGITIGDEKYSLFNSNTQFDESLAKAYNTYSNATNEISEVENDVFYSSSEATKVLKAYESAQKDNDKTKGYLDTALTQTSNDTEKQYINLLIEHNKIYDKYIKLVINYLKDFIKYYDGKMDTTQLSNMASDYQIKLADLTDERDKNVEEIQELLSDNPGLEEKLKTLGIKGRFIGDDK